MKRFTLSRLLSVLLVFSTCAANAQSLADVLSSIQERKRAVQQSQQVAAYLPTVAGSTPTVHDQVLIDWTGLDGVDFPTDDDVASLGIEGQVTLLNQAIVEFRKLSTWYMNLRPDELGGSAPIGALRPYLREDFPELGRADATNHHALLLQLAQNVMRLRVLPWPFACKKQTKHFDIGKWEEWEASEGFPDDFEAVTHYAVGTTPFEGWEPGTLGEGSVPSGSAGTWEYASAGSGFEAAGWLTSLGDQVTVAAKLTTSTYKDDNGDPYELNKLSAGKTTTYHTDAGLFAKIPGRTDDQLGGKVALLSRNSWSPVAPDAVAAPDSWGAGDAGFGIVAVAENAAAATSLGSDSQITVYLQWFVGVAAFEGDVVKCGLPAGFTDTQAYLQGGSYDAWENSYELELDSLGGTRVLARKLFALCSPYFVQGLDAGTNPARLAATECTLGPPSGDASPVLHPAPGLLVGVPLGVGLEGARPGWIGVSPGMWDFNAHDSPPDYVSSGIMYPNWFGGGSNLIRFDYASNLRFCGPAQDFHVVYETSRDPSLRGAGLPSAGPTSAESASSGVGKGSFMTAWDLPRLRQVVSRDLIADVTSEGHYQNTVKIYRRPQSAGAVDRTPNHLETPVPANLIRTLVFSNPSAGTAAYPLTGEKVHIADGTTTHEVRQGTAGSFGAPNTIYFESLNGTAELFYKSIEFDYDEENEAFIETTTTAVDGLTAAVDEAASAYYYGNWWSYQSPDSVKRTAAGVVTTVKNSFDVSSPGSQDGLYPATTFINFPDRPDMTIEWKSSGVVDTVAQGPWSADCSTDGDGLKVTSLFNGSLIGTTWTEWSVGGRKVKTYSAPDGSATVKGATSVDWSELEYGSATGTGTGLPGLPHKLTRRDNSGMTWAWSVNGDGSSAVETREGLMVSGTVTSGSKSTSTTNGRGYPTAWSSFLIRGGIEVQTAGSSTPAGQYSAWGAPLKAVDFCTGLTSSWAFDGNRERLNSFTDALGVVTDQAAYDPVSRLTGFRWDGKAGTMTHNASGFGIATTLAIPSRPHSSHATWDAMGRLLDSGVTAGTTVNHTFTRDADTESVATYDSVTGGTAHAGVRKADGTVTTSTGPTLAFGGIDGSAMSVDGATGLLMSTRNLRDLDAASETTWTDSWGRIRMTQTPSTAPSDGSATDTTAFLYSVPSDTDDPSDPSASISRVRTNAPSGRRIIEESIPYHSTGILRRSGIDLNEDGKLGATDRYVSSLTTLSANTVTTVLSRNEDGGLREILRTVWTPLGNRTVTTTNVNEEEVTRTVDYTASTVAVASNKGWGRDDTFNKLGVTAGSSLTGTGIPATTLDPSWRADGSLSGVSLIIGGTNYSATFNNDGTIATLTAPGITFGGDSIGIDGESVTINGVIAHRSWDGTASGTSGGDAMAKTDALTTIGGLHQTIHPVIAGTSTAMDTTVTYNAAGAATGKQYPAGAGQTYTSLAGGLPDTVSIPRAAPGTVGYLKFSYSGDGAKDLASAAWPAVTSGVFTCGAVSHGYTYNISGVVKSIADPSGSRSLLYDRGRLSETDWNAGLLNGYSIVKYLDGQGRDSGFALFRDGTYIHGATHIPNGVSGEISEVTSGALRIVIARDAARQLTGFGWGDATSVPFDPVVAQTWSRGPGGRIEAASSTVSGAPGFVYLVNPAAPDDSFDSRNRHLKCATAGGVWAYLYVGGQLTSAIHTPTGSSPSLGSFSYHFDGIGRRTDMGDANAADVLGQTTAWTNSQTKTLRVSAASGANVSVGIGSNPLTAIPNFNLAATFNLTLPSTQTSGWVPWHTLAVLPNAGEGNPADPDYNPHASPDAKAEQFGAAWIPPVNESLAYDADGNRQSSALWDYGWDGRNKLARARTKDYNTAVQGYDITCDYDAEGRRFKKFVTTYQNGSITAQDHITFLWDGWDMIYERHQQPSGLTTLERKYVWGPDLSGSHGGAGGAGGLLLIRETRGTQTKDYYPLYDGCGHVIALADGNGVLVAQYAYGPFGELIYAKGPMAQVNPIRYATKYYDSELGLYYFGQRYLDPITNQWLSREPLGEGVSVNLYSYCHSDPINKVDMQGLEEVVVGPVLRKGIPTMIYQDWEGTGLEYLWNAVGWGNVTQPERRPTAEQLAINFYQEDGVWHVASEGARHNAGMAAAMPAVSREMNGIKDFIDATEIGGSVGAILPAGIAMVAAAGPAALAATGEGYLYLGVRGATFLAANEEVLGHLTGAGTLAFLYGASRDQDTAAAALSSQSPMAYIGVALSGVRLLAQDAGTVSAAAWRWAKPGMGNALEASLYKIGRLAYAVPPAAKGTAPIVEDTVSLFHQGTLRGGQVSSTRGLSTSLSSDLSHYRPGGQLYEFQVPRSTYNQWLDEGFVMPKTDLHLPTGIVTPEIRVLPPASGSLNQYLVRPPGG